MVAQLRLVRRMKTLFAAVCNLILGAILGASLMRTHDVNQSYSQAMARLSEVQAQISFHLDLLEKLESDHCDTVKSVLGRQIALSYHVFRVSKPVSADTRELMERIEASSARLPALREALQSDH